MTFSELQKGVIIKFNGDYAVKISDNELLIAGKDTIIISPETELENEEIESTN